MTNLPYPTPDPKSLPDDELDRIASRIRFCATPSATHEWIKIELNAAYRLGIIVGKEQMFQEEKAFRDRLLSNTQCTVPSDYQRIPKEALI